MSGFNLELDTSGLNFLLLVLKARKALSGMSAGERLHLIATDIRAKQDIPAFCKMTVDLFDFREICMKRILALIVLFTPAGSAFQV